MGCRDQFRPLWEECLPEIFGYPLQQFPGDKTNDVAVVENGVAWLYAARRATALGKACRWFYRQYSSLRR